VKQIKDLTRDMNRVVRILYLEDNRLDAELITTRLEADIRCQIVWVVGRESFEAALDATPFDLVLCDYNLPDYDGLSALKCSLASQPRTPVIILSGSFDEEDAITCLHEGATDYVHKQRMTRLTPAIERALKEAGAIARRRQGEEQLRQSEARFRKLVELLPVAVFACDRQGLIQEYNPAAAALWGHTPANGDHFSNCCFMPVDDNLDCTTTNAPQCPVANALLTGEQAKNAETIFQRLDGTQVPVIVNTAALTDCKGEITGSINCLLDITGRKQAEEAIRERDMLLRIAGRTARLGGWSCDLASNQVTWSDEVCAIYEVAPGTHLTLDQRFAFYAAEFKDTISRAFDACVQNGSPYDEEVQIITARGRLVWVRSIGEAVRDGNGTVIQVRGALQDITERKQAEREVHRLAERMSTMLESITDAFFSLDRRWRFTYVNAEAERICRRPLGSLLHKNFWEAFREVEGTPLEQEMKRAVAQCCSVHFETYYETIHAWLEVSVYPSDEGLTVYFRDITERKQTEEHIQFLALYDPLTGLPNRRLLMDRLNHAIATHHRGNRVGAVVFIDLDDFKTLNDTLGHAQGDLLLQQVAARLTAVLREGDTVARLGGDEFVVMLEGLSEQRERVVEQSKALVKKILGTLRKPYQLKGVERCITASIGLSFFGEHGSTADELMKRADLAMYQAKEDGRNTLRFFDPIMQIAIDNRVRLEREMRDGLKQREFLLYYQPQVDESGRIFGAEALARWRHPTRGLVMPGDFIPQAESTGLILPMGNFLLHLACKRLAVWGSRPETAALTLSVNVSPKQFHQPDFVADVLSLVRRTGANPQNLRLELTESLLLKDVEDTARKMKALQEVGIGFSLDDFGTGCSSLYYLKHLPIYELKIDQGFVRDLLTDANDAAIVRTMIVLAHNLGLNVIAEGVECAGAQDYLSRHGCHEFQGYLFGHPLPVEEFEAMVV